MISKETFNSIYPIVERLNEAHVRLSPIDESPIATLNDVGYSPIVDTFHGETGFEDAWVASLKRSPVLGLDKPYELVGQDENVVNIPVSLHSSSMNELVNYVSHHAKNAMSYARNVAVPAINEVTSHVETVISHSNVVKEQYEIVEIGLHAAWSLNIVNITLQSCNPETPVLSRALITKLPQPPEGYFAGLLNSGYVELDNILKSMISEFGFSVEESFNATFNGASHLGINEHPIYMTRNRVLFDYLVCSLVASNPYQGSGLGKDTWSILMHKAMQAIGGQCLRIMKYDQADSRSKVILLGVDDEKTHIYVNRDVYDLWIDAGGCPEIILGARLRDPIGCGHIAYTEMLEESATNAAVWENWKSAEQMRINADDFNAFKRGLFSALTSAINDFDPANGPGGEINTSALMSHAKEIVSRVKPYQLENSAMVCMVAVCDLLFAHTPSKDILLCLEATCANGTSPAEAAILVECDYIIDWLCQGIGIIKL